MIHFFESSYLGPFCAFCSSITWAIGTSCYSRLSKNYSPYAINFYRALVGLPLFVVTAFLISGGFAGGVAEFQEAHLSNWFWLSLSSLSSYGLGDVLFFWSTRWVGISTALAISCCYPIWTVLAGVVFLGHTLSMSQILGLIITVGGVLTVVLNSNVPNATPTKKGLSSSARGLVLASVSSLLWAVNSFAMAQGSATLLPQVGNTIRMLAVLVFCPLLSIVLTPKTSILFPKGVFLKNAWVFFVEGFIGATCLIYGLSHSPLALGVTLTSLAPVISVPIGVTLGIEKFSIPKTIGVCIVVLGISLLLEGFK